MTLFKQKVPEFVIIILLAIVAIVLVFRVFPAKAKAAVLGA
jgi:hypothetical protein